MYVFAPRMSVCSTNNITDRNDIIKILLRVAELITHSQHIFGALQSDKSVTCTTAFKAITK